MALFKKVFALFLALVIGFSTFAGATFVLADELTAPDVTVLQNDYIKVTVDNKTGRFGVRTVEGQPIRKKDQNVDLMFRGDNPESSFTTFRIDGTDYIFGNPYKFGASFFSEITRPQVVLNLDGTRQIETVWKIKGVEIKQILKLYSNPKDLLNAGNVSIRYEVVNRSGVSVMLGSRILLDTMVAGNDGPLFQIGTGYKVPLMVERRLVQHPENNPDIAVDDRAYYQLPPYWVMRDKLDLTNPLATNVMAYGFNSFGEINVNPVEEMIVGHWNSLANTKWDYTPNGNLDFTRDTNDYGTADSAVAFYWMPLPLANQAKQSFETIYGLGEIVEPDKVFSIRFMDTPQQLAPLPDNSGYVNGGVFDIIAEVENLAMYDMEHSNIEVELTLENGLSFVKLDPFGNIVYKDGKPETEPIQSKALIFNKAATPQEQEQGIIPTYKPGDAIATKFKVMAKGKPWPTTKQYMLTAKSPETAAKLERLPDASIKAQYESVKSNFMLLPPIGQAFATQIYGLAPKELFSTDVKYITVNLTNIDAYNTGIGVANPNFDLYIKEIATAKRYKVDVENAVLLQPADDGFSGDMKITYRGGALVDAKGNVVEAGLGPELPQGEYQVQIDFKGDTGGDEEMAALFDVTSSQTFKVTDNPKTRVREANIVAVYKQYVDLSGLDNENSITPDRIREFNKEFPGADILDKHLLWRSVDFYEQIKDMFELVGAKRDPKLKFEHFKEQALEKVPTYAVQIFESEQDLEAFFPSSNTRREKLVVIRGMVKQVGTGADIQTIIDTRTEPAIINNAVAYRGKDLVFTKGKLDIFNVSKELINGSPFFDSLFVRGEGKLSVANSGFTFYNGEWTLDFNNGFEKKIGQGFEIENDVFPMSDDNPEDNSLNGSYTWAIGRLGDRINPLRQLMIEDVYFNRHSLFANPTFMVNGFGISFNDFILRPGGISFGGKMTLKIVTAEARNVIFNDKGFVGIDASLKFNLDNALGLLESPKDKEGNGGEIYITHYVQKVDDINNRYGIKFHAEIDNVVEVGGELAFKQVDDGRILPDVIAFSTTLPKPGVVISAATYLTAIRGAIRELADTIAGGSKKDPFPLTLQAGVDIRFGVTPANLYGSIDLTLKRTGIKIVGKLDYSPKADADKDDLIPMVTKALLEAQWVTPWFIMAQAEVDVLGIGVIIGEAGLFVGQNLKLNRIDFEGYIGARLQIPDKVPVVGGLPLASVFLGANNDKLWGSVGILLIKLGITYYWGGGVEFGTSGEGLPEGLVHLVVEDPEKGPQLLVIGEGIETLATSKISSEQDSHEIVYRNIGQGLSLLENGVIGVGIGNIKVLNGGRKHEIPMNGVSGNAIIEVEYEGNTTPGLALVDGSGNPYTIVFDNTNTNPNANAFTQHITAQQNVNSSDWDMKTDEVDRRRAYIIIPKERAEQGGTWTLTSLSTPVETRLLNVPALPELKEVSLSPNTSEANKFTASWKVDNAKQGDTINLYLAKDSVDPSRMKTIVRIVDGKEIEEQVPDAGDPGLLIAKDVSVNNLGSVSGSTTSGSKVIDVTNVTLMGNAEDIRGLLRSGDYYLRAELKSSSSFGTKTSANKFTLIDPLAPTPVSDVKIEPAGNGYFALSFTPAAVKSGQDGFGRFYQIEAYQEQNGKLEQYSSFPELLYSKEEFDPYWNEQSGRYEGIPVGGWTAQTTSNAIKPESLEGSDAKVPVVKPESFVYTGLEVGHEYVIGVTSVTKPDKNADKNENFHFAAATNSSKRLLPIPALPRITDSFKDAVPEKKNKVNILTKQTQQTVTLYSDQQDLEVEAFQAEQSIGKINFTNTSYGSTGTFSFDQFQTDGEYGIELVATNKRTKDVHTTMLYLTVDTIAPVLYLDQPTTGQRTTDGKIFVSGTTSSDVMFSGVKAISVNGETVLISKEKNSVGDYISDGTFSGWVSVPSSEPNVELNIVARDAAGNENTAIVVITNDSYNVPAGLVLRSITSLQPGQKASITPFLVMPDGRDGQNKPKFKEVAMTEEERSRLSYSVTAGDAVTLSGSEVTGFKVGTSFIEGKYRVAEGITLEAMTYASVEVPAPTSLQSISAITQENGSYTSTRVVIGTDEDLVGYQLLYKKFPNAQSVTAPTFNQVLTDWSFVPPTGDIEAQSSDKIVVVKRNTLTQKVVSVSAPLPVNITQESPGGGLPIGGPGGPIGGPGGPIGGNPGIPVPPGPKDDKGNVTSEIKLEDILKAGDKEIKLVSDDTSAKGFKFKLNKDVRDHAVSNDKPITIQVPMATFVLTPKMLASLPQDLEVSITSNDEQSINAGKIVADSTNSSLLGGGQGVMITTNIPEDTWTSYARTKIRVPDGIKADEITALVLTNPDGSWTTVPWKLEYDEKGLPVVDVRMSGNGSLSFIRSTKTFTDVESGSWAEESIRQAAAKLFVQGKADTTFEPDSQITRAEYPTLLLRVAGLMNKSGHSEFTDVGNQDWFNRSVSVAAKLGIVEGLEDGSYAPEATITRVEAMTMIGRLMAALGIGQDLSENEVDRILSTFDDRDAIPDWARKPTAISIMNGIIEGDGNWVNPGDALTRAQAAAISIRLDRWISGQ
ncbi:S-layer homology domain-containing protein [Paenibacillus koleovorans]|uniref:S-layer homology domain-containing protein n=1 Tax=Paenibacillus koleovorans TaxID=121608 RepID=UPI000FDC132E|nr:S-layer homology domain-containing protein [Paenibacillus koleovorans]